MISSIATKRLGVFHTAKTKRTSQVTFFVRKMRLNVPHLRMIKFEG
jgi:hypothetical protein